MLLTIILTVLVLGTSLAAPENDGRIVFQSNRDGNWEIYVMDADGRNQKRLTNEPATDERPSWSPDGTKIAFGSQRGGNTDIYVMNANGGGLKRLTTDPGDDYAPQWSPDGTKITFRSSRDGNKEVYVMNADGSGQTNISNNRADDHGPIWSPDGTRIAFSSDRAGNNDIYLMNPDGSNVVQLTTDPEDDRAGAFSPDGTQIAFRSSRDGNIEIYVMNADGSNQTNLTNDPAADRGPTWSPDGTYISYYTNRSGNYEIYIMKADGSGKINLTQHPDNDFSPDWGDGDRPPPPVCYQLTLNASPTDGGAITTAPAANCANGRYEAGTEVILTAEAAEGYAFDVWQGSLSGRENPHTIVMDQDKSATAVFLPQELCYTVSYTIMPSAGGDVNAEPPPNCAGGKYAAGTELILTATAAAGYGFDRWGGDLRGTANPVSHTLAGDLSVRAHFEPASDCYLLSTTYSGEGIEPESDPVSSAGCANSQYTPGQAIVLTASPAEGWRVGSWSGTSNDGSQASANSVTMPSNNHSIAVNYEPIPVECLTLAVEHTGEGIDPQTAPASSGSCALGSYVPSTQIAVSASAAPGWFVIGWSGTQNDNDTSESNTVVMPAIDHRVVVHYAQTSNPVHETNIPLILVSSTAPSTQRENRLTRRR